MVSKIAMRNELLCTVTIGMQPCGTEKLMEKVNRVNSEQKAKSINENGMGPL